MSLSRNARKAIARKKRLAAVETNQKRTVAIMVQEGLARNRKIIDANVGEMRNTRKNVLQTQGIGPRGFNTEAHCYAMRRK